MNSDLLTKWTAIITNIAVVVGLVFVGLEFRNNTRAYESERIDSFTQGGAAILISSINEPTFAEILLRSYADPESLTNTELDRIQHWLLLHHSNFRRIHRAYKSGLLPADIYEPERAGVGFAFASDIGIEVIEAFSASEALENETWEVIRDSVEQARAYCLDSQNVCLERYKILGRKI